MGLIARELEAAGIPTLSLSSAWSITAAVNPPRAAFVDFPLGHTAGKPNEPEFNARLIQAALEAFAVAGPGSITRLPFRWAATDEWKTALLEDLGDDRVERFNTPQYQTAADAVQADANCPSCIWLTDDSKINRPGA